MIPITIAAPPMSAIRAPLQRTGKREIRALHIPTTASAITETTTETTTDTE